MNYGKTKGPNTRTSWSISRETNGDARTKMNETNIETYEAYDDAAVGPENYLYAVIYKASEAKWGYFLNNHADRRSNRATDYETFVCGFETEDAAIDHANTAAWEKAREASADSGCEDGL